MGARRILVSSLLLAGVFGAGCLDTETTPDTSGTPDGGGETFDTGAASSDAASPAVDASSPGDVAAVDATSGDAESPDASAADASGEDASGADTGALDAGCTLAPERGSWMYRHPGNALGTDAFVGDAAEEAAALANLQAALITRVYGNYGARPVDDVAAIAAWNAQLHDAGIESQLLLGDAADIFPGCREALLEEIDQRFIAFNAQVAPAEAFKAVHLDIEPHQYKQSAAFPTTTSCGLRIKDWDFWDEIDDAERARYYERLLKTFAAVRDHLDANGHSAVPLYVDLAPWIDSSASFDWSATSTPIADGADWLAQTASQVTGMTFMTYERDSAASIDSSVATEAGLPTELRVSVNARERAPLSTTTTWTGLAAMWGVVDALEQSHCGARPVDIFAYRYLHE